MSLGAPFWYAVGVCCLQAIFHHRALSLSSAYVWPCLAVASLAPLLYGKRARPAITRRAALDCLLDAASLILPAMASVAYPCAASLTAATLFRSLALPLVALLKGKWQELPFALVQSLLLTCLTMLRSRQCVGEADGAVAVAALLFSATLATAVFSVRQETEPTWRTTNLARVPLVFVALLCVADDVPDLQSGAFFAYAVLSVLASGAVLRYNAYVREDAYLKTRMLSTRRLISAALGILVLDDNTALVVLLSVLMAAAAFVSDFHKK
jgi:hypothetical protein